MSFDHRRHPGKSTIAQPSAERASTPGKHTLTSLIAVSSTPSSPGASIGGAAGKAEYGGGDVRARIGSLAEGSHAGVKKGGPGKRRIGHIAGGSFVRAAAPAQPAAQPTEVKGQDGDRAFVGSASSQVADRTTSDSTTSVRMEDESDDQAAMIAAAVTRAREILDNAIAKIGSPADPRVAAALQANFHSTEAKVVSEVSSKLQRIRSAFNGTIPVEVESEGTARAYVYVIWSDIHLCPPWFADTNPDARARTIIHECSHKYTGTDDKAYHWDGKYATLSTKDAWTMPTRTPGSASTCCDLGAAPCAPTMGRAVRWTRMGLVMALLSAIGCGPGGKAGATTPVLADYDVALHAGRALSIDPAAATSGRFQIVPGNKLVLELSTVRGKSAIAYDTAAAWSVVLELPENPDPGQPMEVTLDGVPAIARVAGEDVLYLARKAKGRIKLTRTSDPVTGEIEIAFTTPDRDLIKLGTYALHGAFKAKIK